MELTRKKRGVRAQILGAVGVTAIACAACCASLPLIGPVLAWLGLAGIGAIATGWEIAAAAVFALGVGAFLLVRQYRRSVLPPTHSGACGCRTSCKT